MSNRNEELIVLLSKKEKEFIIKNASDKSLSIEDFIMLSALSLDSSRNIKKSAVENVT